MVNWGGIIIGILVIGLLIYLFMPVQRSRPIGFFNSTWEIQKNSETDCYDIIQTRRSTETSSFVDLSGKVNLSPMINSPYKITFDVNKNSIMSGQPIVRSYIYDGNDIIRGFREFEITVKNNRLIANSDNTFAQLNPLPNTNVLRFVISVDSDMIFITMNGMSSSVRNDGSFDPSVLNVRQIFNPIKILEFNGLFLSNIQVCPI